MSEEVLQPHTKEFSQHDKEVLENSGRVIVTLPSVSLQEIIQAAKNRAELETMATGGRYPAQWLQEKLPSTQVALDPQHFYANYKGELFTGREEDFYEIGSQIGVSNRPADPFQVDALKRGVNPYEEGMKRYQQKYIDPLGLENAEVIMGQAAYHAQLALQYFQENGVNLYGDYYAHSSTGDLCVGLATNFHPEYNSNPPKLIVGRFESQITSGYVLLDPLIVPK